MTRKRTIAAVAVAAAVVGAALFHAPLLRGIVRPLVAEQPTSDCDGICLISNLQSPEGDRCYYVAAKLWRENPAAAALIVEPPENRIVAAGGLPSFAAISRRELSVRGLPDNAVSILPSDGNDDWAIARSLNDWLLKHPESVAVVLCDEFHSGRLRAAIDETLGSARAKQMRIAPLPDRRFNRGDWWKTRVGARTVGMEWIMLLRHWLCGREPCPPPAAAGDYERNLIESWGEGP